MFFFVYCLLGCSLAQFEQQQYVVFDSEEEGYDTQEMIKADQGFCYISSGASWTGRKRGRDNCQITLQDRYGHAYWILESVGEYKDFKCSATCVYTFVEDMSDEFIIEGAFKNVTTLDLGTTEERICYFTHGSAWASNRDYCMLEPRDGNWYMQAESRNREFGCGARCVQVQNLTFTEDELIVRGREKRKYYQAMEPEMYCFLTQGQSFWTGHGTCELKAQDDGGWSIESESKSKSFVCGARCAAMPVIYKQMDGYWDKVAESYGGSISKTTSYGVSRADGRSVTNTFSHSFTLSIGINLCFVSISMSWTWSWSIAHTVSETTTKSKTDSLQVSCPAREGYHIAIYQWIIRGESALGPDHLYTQETRCHYSLHPDVPYPQCPALACTDDLCTEATCLPWKKEHPDDIPGLVYNNSDINN